MSRKELESTHEHVEHALYELGELLVAATPQEQPSEHVLSTFVELLKLHREGVPGNDYDEQLEELRQEIEQLKSQIGMVEVLGGGAAQGRRRG